jgi:hypothetical protein
MRIFVCHSTLDAKFVIQVASLLRSSCEEVFYYEEQQRADTNFQVTIDNAMKRCDGLVIFVGGKFSKWQESEAVQGSKKENLNVCTVFIRQPNKEGSLDEIYPEEPAGLGAFTGKPQIKADINNPNEASTTAWRILRYFGITPHPIDGLPYDQICFLTKKMLLASSQRCLGPEEKK